MDLGELKEAFSSFIAQPVVRDILRFLHDWKPENWVLLYLLAALILGLLVGRYRISKINRILTLQNRGEALMSSILKSNFTPPDYHLMNHITLELPDGTTQIDHILVSRFGVFVIETKDYKGWIYGNLKQKSWTQVFFQSKRKFQNPIHQNSRHVRAVQNLLDFLPPDAVKSIVVFTGNAEFKTEIPSGVHTSRSISNHIEQHSVEVMSHNRMQFCVGRLETARLAISKKTDIEHIESLQLRHRSG
ncbi:NERD domain-containing protein [bacterium]|nr:NERD domain-containing protein [bacterium]